MIQCIEINSYIAQLKAIFNDRCKTVTPRDIKLIVEVIEAIYRCGGSDVNLNDYVSYLVQVKTEVEKEIARNNIGAVSQQQLDDLTSIVQTIITSIENQIFNFSQQTVVTCVHELGKKPNVSVLIGTKEVLADIEHMPDFNSVIVRFSQPKTGIVIIN